MGAYRPTPLMTHGRLMADTNLLSIARHPGAAGGRPQNVTTLLTSVHVGEAAQDLCPFSERLPVIFRFGREIAKRHKAGEQGGACGERPAPAWREGILR
jgi:hypothetical protein